MEEDLVTSLTRQVKEEVIENYLLERRLIELQIENLQRQAEETSQRARLAGLRLSRLSFLVIRPDMRERLKDILKPPEGSFWISFLDGKLRRNLPLIGVRALSRKGRYRKLVLEAYGRLYEWMNDYRAAYGDLEGECRAVNSNIQTFHRNFDLLSILNFLRNLDFQGLERKRILGENFTAKEMSELDRNLYIRPIVLEKLSVPVPLDMPGPRQAADRLSALSEEVFRKYEQEVVAILR